MIRVWIETSSAVTRAGFESLLEDADGIEFVPDVSDADVILSEDVTDSFGIPVVIVSDEPSVGALRDGVRAILPRDAAPEQITAALHAASAGLIAVPMESRALLTRAAVDEAPAEALTPREIEVLEMLAEGLSNKQIAGKLSISEHTAKFHVNSILGKLHAGTRTEAVTRGFRLGLIKV